MALRRERRRGRRYQPRFRLNQIGVTSLAALCAVLLLGLLTLWSGQLLIVAPLGASCVLLFGYPASPRPSRETSCSAMGSAAWWVWPW